VWGSKGDYVVSVSGPPPFPSACEPRMWGPARGVAKTFVCPDWKWEIRTDWR